MESRGVPFLQQIKVLIKFVRGMWSEVSNRKTIFPNEKWNSLFGFAFIENSHLDAVAQEENNSFVNIQSKFKKQFFFLVPTECRIVQNAKEKNQFTLNYHLMLCELKYFNNSDFFS